MDSKKLLRLKAEIRRRKSQRLEADLSNKILKGALKVAPFLINGFLQIRQNKKMYERGHTNALDSLTRSDFGRGLKNGKL